MDNTKDSPMDYKQFEGHTPGPWEVLSGYKKPWSVWSIKEQLLICARVHGNDYSQSSANAKLVAAAPDLLKENQELKLELQKQKEEIQHFELERTEMYHKYEKQKELNAELVKVSNNNKCELLDRYTEFLQKEGYIDTDATMEHPTAIDIFLKKDRANESLIKKSSEI